ncbi:MAG: tetratricopeptide repeat protein [Deltaproteobacteria bacterium]|nr:tetratricopeptide repeat protein [Deltaproteobacteria bacterium]
MTRQEERSDLFSVDKGSPSLDPVSQVLLPPEERRKQRVRRILAGIGLVILLALTGWTVRHFWHRHSVEANAETAGSTGRTADIRTALDTLDSGELPGLRARLTAMLALSGEGSVADAEAAVAAVPEDDAHEASERLKASVYVALAKGEAAVALEAANRLISAGDFAAETAWAKSRAQVANGADGVAEAAGAAQLVPGARYVAHHAEALTATGNAAAALETLDGAEGPAADLARARALHESFGEGASEAAESVLTAESATRAEKGWAEAILAYQAARTGARRDARSHAAQALELAPPGDHGFVWFVAESLTTAGATEQARQAIEGLPTIGPVADAHRRGRVLAALSLAAGDADTALEHLSTVAASPEALLLVGHARWADDQLDEARASYDRAAESPHHVGLARASRAALELDADEPEEALAQARLALEASPLHPAVAPVVVSAMLANELADEAMGVAERALAQSPEDVRLLAAKADVLLAKESWEEALTVLRDAVEREADDAELHAELGDAARGAERWDEAGESYGRALELEERNVQALVGLFQLQVITHALDEAAETWETIDDTIDDATTRVDKATALARVRYLVDAGTGRRGMRELTQLSRRRDLRRDAGVRFAMAENLLQQGNHNRAFAMFVRARALGGDDVEAYLGQALAQVLKGRMNRATDALREAKDASLPADAAPDADAPAMELPRYLVTRGWIEANLGRFPAAGNLAERALEADPDNTMARLLMAIVDARSRRDPTPNLRAAIDGVPSRPMAMARLAIRLGTEGDGCALAARYLDVAPYGEDADAVKEVAERCEEQSSGSDDD